VDSKIACLTEDESLFLLLRKNFGWAILRTRLVQRPIESFVDSLITSISALLITMLSFAALYSYVGVGLYGRNEVQAKLVRLDQLLALRRLTTLSSSVPTRAARTRDLPQFFLGAADEAFDRVAAELEQDENSTNSKPLPPSKFDDTLVPGSNIAFDLPMRMAVNGTCDALVTQLASGETFQVVTWAIVGSIRAVSSDKVKLASFFGCQPTLNSEFQVLIFTLDNDQYAFAIPISLEEDFLGFRKPPGISSFPLENATRIAELVPNVLKPYVRLKGTYVYVHGKAIDYFILNFANMQLGKRLTPDRIEDVVQLLYEQKDKETSYFGINASSVQLIRFGPLIFFLLSFELWRRVRRLPNGKLSSDKYWFAFETSDILGRAYAYLWAIAPVLLGCLIYGVFATSQGMGWSVFGRVVSLPGLLTLSFPVAAPPGWTTSDNLAFAVLLFVPVQFLILVVTVRKLVRVVGSNLRPRSR
jgi:hypothetical protein